MEELAKSNENLFKDIFKKYGLIYDKEDKKNSDVFITKQFKIITRSGINKIQAKAKIQAKYEIVFIDTWEVGMKGTFTDMNNNVIETFASASCDRKEFIKVVSTRMKDGVLITQEEVQEFVSKGGNVRQSDPYLLEMAEKRCMARGVLTLAGLYAEGFYSEDEADDFAREVKRERRS